MDSTLRSLEQATADLDLVINAGLLSEFRAAIAYSRRGLPATDYYELPGLKWRVDEFAEQLQYVTGLPMQFCRFSALNHLLPDNRHQQSVELLHQFAENIRAQAARDRGSRLLERRNAS